MPFDSNTFWSFFNKGFAFLILFSQTNRMAEPRLRIGRMVKDDLVYLLTQQRSALLTLETFCSCLSSYAHRVHL